MEAEVEARQQPKQKLDWECCGCSCQGHAAQKAGLRFWIYTYGPGVLGGKNEFYLGVGHGFSRSKPVGKETYGSFEDADAAAYEYAKQHLRENPHLVTEAQKLIADARQLVGFAGKV